MNEAIQRLQKKFPWPAEAPDVEVDWGPKWFLDDEHYGHTKTLLRWAGDHVKVVLELGSFLGRSANALLRIFPNAHVLTVDNWQGSSEHLADPELRKLLPNMERTFRRNLWYKRERVTPITASTQEGMRVIHECGVIPDLIYVDASHKTEDALEDILTACRLFPTAQLVGDDWRWGSVRAAVEQASEELEEGIRVDGNLWWLEGSHGS